jgi:hypothetical protein
MSSVVPGKSSQQRFRGELMTPQQIPGMLGMNMSQARQWTDYLHGAPNRDLLCCVVSNMSLKIGQRVLLIRNGDVLHFVRDGERIPTEFAEAVVYSSKLDDRKKVDWRCLLLKQIKNEHHVVAKSPSTSSATAPTLRRGNQPQFAANPS